MKYRVQFELFEVWTSRQSAKGSRQKNRRLPIAHCQLPTLRMGWEKTASRPIIFKDSLILLICHANDCAKFFLKYVNSQAIKTNKKHPYPRFINPNKS